MKSDDGPGYCGARDAGSRVKKVGERPCSQSDFNNMGGEVVSAVCHDEARWVGRLRWLVGKTQAKRKGARLAGIGRGEGTYQAEAGTYAENCEFGEGERGPGGARRLLGKV